MADPAILVRSSFVRRLLDRASRPGRDGKSWIERHWDNGEPSGGFWNRLLCALPCRIVELALRSADALPRRRAHARFANLAVHSVARYGLTLPQRFAAPVVVIWSFDRSSSLDCEMDLQEKLRALDELADCGVPYLLLAGPDPLAHRHAWPVLVHAHRRGLGIGLSSNDGRIHSEDHRRLWQAGIGPIEIVPEHAAFDGEMDSEKSCLSCAIQPDGSVTTGLRARSPRLGDLRSQPFSTLWERSSILSATLQDRCA